MRQIKIIVNAANYQYGPHEKSYRPNTDTNTDKIDSVNPVGRGVVREQHILQNTGLSILEVYSTWLTNN